MQTDKGSLEESSKKTLEMVNAPYDLHVLVCTNTRGEGQKKSCGPLGADALRADLKEWLKAEIQSRPRAATKLKARVNASGCLDFCSKGIAVAIYPQSQFLLNVSSTSTEEIKSRLKLELDRLESRES